VRRGKPFGFTSEGHDSDTFIELLDVIDAVYPPGRGRIIMDNLSAHDTPGVNEWFDEHLRWTRHFTPKHASWLNPVECWFSILGRQLPFRWSYRPKSWLTAYLVDVDGDGDGGWKRATCGRPRTIEGMLSFHRRRRTRGGNRPLSARRSDNDQALS